jgi:hypothetical protein
MAFEYLLKNTLEAVVFAQYKPRAKNYAYKGRKLDSYE